MPPRIHPWRCLEAQVAVCDAPRVPFSQLEGTHAPKKFTPGGVLRFKWRCVTLRECRSVSWRGPMPPTNPPLAVS